MKVSSLYLTEQPVLSGNVLLLRLQLLFLGLLER